MVLIKCKAKKEFLAIHVWTNQGNPGSYDSRFNSANFWSVYLLDGFLEYWHQVALGDCSVPFWSHKG